MSKTDKSAPSGSKRRVQVRRKGAAPDVDPAIAYAIATAVEAQGIEELRNIVVKQEAQMHTLRVILFDMLIIYREEHYNAQDPVSKKRFATHIQKIRNTLEQNVAELKKYHDDQGDVDDLDANTEEAEFMDAEGVPVDISALVRQIGDNAVDAGELDAREADLMDEMLERASQETDEAGRITDDAGGYGPRRHPETQAREPRPPRRRAGRGRQNSA